MKKFELNAKEKRQLDLYTYVWREGIKLAKFENIESLPGGGGNCLVISGEQLEENEEMVIHIVREMAAKIKGLNWFKKHNSFLYDGSLEIGDKRRISYYDGSSSWMIVTHKNQDGSIEYIRDFEAKAMNNEQTSGNS